QFQGIVWMPTNASAGDVEWTGPTGTTSSTATAGTGPTSARDVAVELLHHVPLPELQIRMNPALGLVAVPGWFWVQGYDGQPFGASQTVRLPPEVGPNVPLSVVP